MKKLTLKKLISLAPNRGFFIFFTPTIHNITAKVLYLDIAHFHSERPHTPMNIA
jgi:hypothetical protein